MAHRTQITLSDEQYMRLQTESAQTGLSLAELIRRAVDDAYGVLSIEEKLRLIDEGAGLWADRDDLPRDGVEYVEQLRGPGLGERLRSLGLDDDEDR